jgi:hypothetical protein
MPTEHERCAKDDDSQIADRRMGGTNNALIEASIIAPRRCHSAPALLSLQPS